MNIEKNTINPIALNDDEEIKSNKDIKP